MLNQITCDTHISELLDINDVETKLDTCKNIITTYLKFLEEPITIELNKGGLSKEAFFIDDNPLLNYEGLDLLEELTDLETEYATYINTVLSQAEEQRRKEIAKLKEKVQEKINSIKSEIRSVYSIIMELKSFSNPEATQSYQNKLNNLNNSLDYYSKKYEELNGLK